MSAHPRSVSEIVDHQVRKWVLEREEGTTRRRRQPVVTVSHQHGSGGSAVAAAVAERLGYRCWDRQLLGEIARHSDAPEAMVASLDERTRNYVNELIGAFTPGSVTAWDYVRGLKSVVQAISQHGSAVIVGRGAHHMVELEAALRVRVVRSLEQRIEAVMERDGVERRQAHTRIREVDGNRRRFIHDQFGVDNADPGDYDLVVNTSVISIECAADIVVAAFRRNFGEPPRPRPALRTAPSLSTSTA